MNIAVESMQPLPNVIEPQWWTGKPALAPQSFTIDCSGFSMDDTDLRNDSELAMRMRAMFRDVGLVYLINTRLTDLAMMREFAKIVIENEMRYKARRQSARRSGCERVRGWRTSAGVAALSPRDGVHFEEHENARLSLPQSDAGKRIFLRL